MAENISARQALDELTNKFGSALAAVPELEKRQKEYEAARQTDNTELRTQLKKQDDAIAEILGRIERGEKIEQEGPGFRLGPDGRIRAKVSDKFAEFGMRVFTKSRELSEAVGADGGYLIAPEYRWELQQLLLNYGVARQECTVVPMKTPSMIFPNLVSGMRVYWTTENQAPSAQAYPSFSQVQIDTKKLMGLTHISDELLEDSNIQIGQLLIDLFAREIAKEEDKQCFLGTGSGADPFTGVFNLPQSGALNGNLTVVTSNATSFNTVTADDLLNMQTATPLPALPGAKYYMHRSIFDIIRKLKTTTGEYIYAQPNGPQQQGTVWGYPVVMPEILPGIGQTALNTPFIAFANMNHMALGDRHTQEIARSDHFAFDKMQAFIRIHERVGFKSLRNDYFTVLFTAAS